MAFHYHIKASYDTVRVYQIKKIVLTKPYFKQFHVMRKFELQGFFMDKGSGSGIFPDPDPDPGDPKRPDPTGSGSESATLV